MLPKKLVTLAVAAAIATGPVSRASADAHGLIGAIIGGAIIGNAIQNSNRNKRVVVRSGVSSATRATRAANRETQTALNYFGYPAGTPDGVLGRKSRAAVSSMQAYLGFPVTGRLTQFERDILVGAYHRGTTGSFETVQLISKSPDGPRALLVAQKDMMTGGTTTARRTTGYAGMPLEVSDAIDEIAESSDPSAEQLLQRSGFIQLSDMNGDGNNDYILDTSFSGSSFWCSAVQCKTIVFVSTPSGYARNDLLAFDPTPASFNCVGSSCVVNEGDTVMVRNEVAVPAAPTAPTTMVTNEVAVPGLTLFAAPSVTSVSLDSHCSKVSLMTNANGGFIQASAIADPNMVMNEQLCLARAYAIENGERLVESLGSVTMAQAEAQCAPFGPTLKEYVSSLSLKPRADVIRDVGGFVLTSGMDPAQLMTTAKICLAAGYRMDDMDIALGSGMLLVVLGETPYGELMGHHLSQGFGASKQVDLALAWYQNALDSLGQGAAPVFAPGQIERPMLIQAAVDMMGGGQAEAKPIAASGSKAKLPTFGAPKNFSTPKN